MSAAPCDYITIIPAPPLDRLTREVCELERSGWPLDTPLGTAAKGRTSFTLRDMLNNLAEQERSREMVGEVIEQLKGWRDQWEAKGKNASALQANLLICKLKASLRRRARR